MVTNVHHIAYYAELLIQIENASLYIPKSYRKGLYFYTQNQIDLQGIFKHFLYTSITNNTEDEEDNNINTQKSRRNHKSGYSEFTVPRMQQKQNLWIFSIYVILSFNTVKRVNKVEQIKYNNSYSILTFILFGFDLSFDFS